jgi:bleomycin hydrolase
MRRQGKSPDKLSEMFVVYWEYVEKARGFVRSRGRSTLGEGSQESNPSMMSHLCPRAGSACLQLRS